MVKTTAFKTYEHEVYARCDLRDDGYALDRKRNVWTSADGLIDAVIMQDHIGEYFISFTA